MDSTKTLYGKFAVFILNKDQYRAERSGHRHMSLSISVLNKTAKLTKNTPAINPFLINCRL